MINSKIGEAVAFAVLAHSAQTKKGTEVPYIFHPMEAGAIASRITDDTDIVCAAVLHDVLEDANVPLPVIEEKFGAKVRRLAEAQSEDKSKPWEERKKHTIESLPLAKEDVKIVALCDKLSNVRALTADHLKSGEELWKRFNVTDPAKQAWYYLGLVDSLNDLNKLPEYSEFSDLAHRLFDGYKKP